MFVEPSSAARADRVTQPRAVYIHVPFCAHRCGYCDFTLIAGRDDLAGAYLDALQAEIERSPLTEPLDTLFLGGGTPTQLDEPHLQRLLDLLRSAFRFSPDIEFNVEANPDGLTDAKLDALANAGVKRLSLGVQSFDDRFLSVLERRHSSESAIEAFGRCRSRFPDVSLDLIFAVPGQTLADWQHDLQTAIALQPNQVSTYGLTFEKGTTFWTRREKGQLDQADDSLERSMYGAAMDQLAAAGFEHYEISSFARPGFRCRHNQVYWNGGEYLGFGPGAASFDGGVRWQNHRSTTTWIRKVLAGEDAIGDREQLDPEASAREHLILGLRQIEGLNVAAFETQTGFALEPLGGEALSRLQDQSLLELTDDTLRLTREGRFFYDTVAADLV
ncbi:radical SAM family heme chaperone HemW [bacterium]|nr:radical SAM family heme chaperone HemW [bacterium]